MAKQIPCGLFVTGTDTGVGKTQVAAALAHLLADRNLVVRPPENRWNQVADGGRKETAWRPRMPGRYKPQLERISPWRTSALISWSRHCRRNGRQLCPASGFEVR